MSVEIESLLLSVAAMEILGVKGLATNDENFDAVTSINVWKFRLSSIAFDLQRS